MSWALSVTVTTLSVLLTTAAYADECSNVLFANDENTLVVLFHNNQSETALTEIRNGTGTVCEATWSFGYGGYEANCPDGRYVPIKMIYDGNESLGIRYGDETLALQCAKPLARQE